MKAYKYRRLIKNAEGAEGILRKIKKVINFYVFIYAL